MDVEAATCDVDMSAVERAGLFDAPGELDDLRLRRGATSGE
jgi:hypothetical protein